MRNASWGLAGRIVSMAGPFLVRALLVSRLGADYLGLGSLFASVLHVLNLAELGFSTAVAYGMYAPLAKGDGSAVACHLAYLKRVYRWVGAAILAAGVCLMPAFGLLIRGEAPRDVNLQLAFFMYLANTASSYLLFAHKQTLLVATQRKDLVDKANIVVLVVQYGVQALLLLTAPNFYSYAIAMPLCTVAGNLIVAWVCDRRYPQFRDAELAGLGLDADRRRSMRKRILGLLLQKACIVTRESFAAVVVAAFVSLEAVAAFANYFVVIGGVLGLLGTLASSMTASVGNSVAAETVQKNADDLRLFVFLYAVLSVVAAAVIAAVYQPFMALWVGKGLVLPDSFAVLMVAYFYVRTMGDVRTVYVDATGVWWDLRWRALAETLGNLVLVVALTALFGLNGAALGLLISLFVFNFAYGSHLIFKLYFGLQRARFYYADHALYCAVGIVSCLVSSFACQIVPGIDWAGVASRALLACVCATAVLVAVFGWTQRWRRSLDFAYGLLRRARR